MESQTEPDRDAEFRWPYYTAYLHDQQKTLAEALKSIDDDTASIIEVLEERAIVMDDEDRLRILSCSDAATLRSWLTRALHVSKVSELFAD